MNRNGIFEVCDKWNIERAINDSSTSFKCRCTTFLHSDWERETHSDWNDGSAKDLSHRSSIPCMCAAPTTARSFFPDAESSMICEAIKSSLSCMSTDAVKGACSAN